MRIKYLVLAGIVTIMLFPNILFPALGDGFTVENLPPASLGDRKAGLFIQVNPPILTVESVKNASVFLRLYDANTNNTIQHVSYFIKVEKGGKTLMQDLFHAHNGELTLKIVPKQSPILIFGDKEPFLEGWTSMGGPVTVQGPIFLEGGLYHFLIEIFGVDSDKNIFKQEDAPKFESWLSVGDISNNSVTYQQQNYPISVISYYDRIRDFSFDPQTGQISYVMPFDWDVSRLEKNPIFVHEEINIPRNLTILASGEFAGTVNGMELPSEAILVDDSNPDRYVVHYMLRKDHIIKFASELQASPDGQPSDAIAFTLSSKESFFLERTTGDGNVKVRLMWNPMKIEPGSKITFELKFFDAKTGNTLNNVNYDFMLIKDGEDLTHRTSQQAADGVSTQEFTFDPSQQGSVRFRLENINNTNESVEFPINVLPEFSAGFVAVLLAVALAGAIFATKKYKPLMSNY
ncbi:MAG: hypothetical protein HMLIMOIP_002405 [Candidatus Nitrosomirales archaeon]|jgi:hypothetical protein